MLYCNNFQLTHPSIAWVVNNGAFSWEQSVEKNASMSHFPPKKWCKETYCVFQPKDKEALPLRLFFAPLRLVWMAAPVSRYTISRVSDASALVLCWVGGTEEPLLDAASVNHIHYTANQKQKGGQFWLLKVELSHIPEMPPHSDSDSSTSTLALKTQIGVRILW